METLTDLKGIKSSLRIDHTLDDNLLLNYIEAAKMYIVSAVDSRSNSIYLGEYSQFDIAVSLLAQHYYLNRQEASSERIPVIVQSLIQQLRGLHYAVSE